MSFNEQDKSLDICKACGRPMPRSSAGVCPRCRDERLFHEVKEYINSNNVTEFDVAEHFNIPLSQVRTWIREGRVDYARQFLQGRPPT